MVAGKPKDLYDNLASSQKAGKSRDRAIAKESRATLTGSLLERLIAATTLNRIAPSYTHVLQDQIGAGEKTYTMAQRGTQLDERTGNRLRERVDRSRLGTERVRPAYMGEGDIMMDPYVKGDSVEGLAGQGYTGYTGTFETGFGDVEMDVAGRDLAFSNPMREPYSGGEVLGAREAQQTAQTFGYGGGSGGGGATRSLYGGSGVSMDVGETEFERQRRFEAVRARSDAEYLARMTQSQNPLDAGAYDVSAGGSGGGAAFDRTDGGGFFQEQDELSAYRRLGGVPPEERPIPSDIVLRERMGMYSEEALAQEEKEAFRQYIRANPTSGTFMEFRDPNVFKSIQGGSLDQLDPNTPSAFSVLSSASTASGGAFRVHGNLGRKDTPAQKKTKSKAQIAAYGREKAAPYVIESVLKRVDTFIEQRELGTM